MGNKYRLSLTGVQFAQNETILVTESYLKNGDWEKTKEEVVENYLLGSEKKNSNIRKFREIKIRLQNLTDSQLSLIRTGSSTDQKIMIYLAICKTYPIIQEYVTEIIREKVLRFDYLVFDSDYNIFYQNKSETITRLQDISESTQVKIKRVLHKILFDFGILEEGKEGHSIVPPILSEEIKNIIREDNKKWLKCFLLTDGEL